MGDRKQPRPAAFGLALPGSAVSVGVRAAAYGSAGVSDGVGHRGPVGRAMGLRDERGEACRSVGYTATVTVIRSQWTQSPWRAIRRPPTANILATSVQFVAVPLSALR